VFETYSVNIASLSALGLRRIAKLLADGKLTLAGNISVQVSAEASLADEQTWLLSMILSEVERTQTPNSYAIRLGSGTSPTSTPG
jgi:hypothetical protein